MMFIIISLSILLLSIKCHGSHSSYHHAIDDVTTANAMSLCDSSCPNLLSTTSTSIMMITTEGKEAPIGDSKCCSTHVSSPYSGELSSPSLIPTAPSSCGTCQSSTCSGNGFKSCLDHHHPHSHSHPPMKMMTEQQCQAYQSSNCVVMLANPLCDPSSSICWGTITTNMAVYSGN